MTRTHPRIQRSLGVHQRASFDAEKFARVRVSLGQHSGVWSVGDNFLPGANSPRTRWGGWRPRSKDGSRPVCPRVIPMPNEATVIRPISSLQALHRIPSQSEADRRFRSPTASLPTRRPNRRCGPRNTSLRCHAANSGRTGGSPACDPTRGAPLTRRKRASHSPPPRSRGTRAPLWSLEIAIAPRSNGLWYNEQRERPFSTRSGRRVRTTSHVRPRCRR
jgi:hypothetical protein